MIRRPLISLLVMAVFVSGYVSAAIPLPEETKKNLDPVPSRKPALHEMSAALIREHAQSAGFFALENRLQAEASSDLSVDSAKNLAAFYAAHQLHVEALAVLRQDLPPTAELQHLRARSQYAMGRYAQAIELLADERLQQDAAAQVLLAQALTRLGGYEEAHQIMQRDFSEELPPDADADAFLRLAQASIARRDSDNAERLLAATPRKGLDIDEKNHLLFLQGMLELLRDKTVRSLNALEATGGGSWSAWASLKVIEHRFREGDLAAREARQAIETLALRTDRADIQRDIAWARLTFQETLPLTRTYFEELRSFISRFKASDQRALAEQKLRDALKALFTVEQTLRPMEAAQIFYENIDYAPPGRGGDAMIRDVADRLLTLDLGDAAVELLEHQVFKRLRGAQRSIIAADLAEAYLTLQRPSEALRVLRSTRIAGLADPIALRRKLLEAMALEKTGEAKQALQRLEQATSIEAAALKADILWRSQNWFEAAATYHYLMTKSGVTRDKAEEAFIRAGVSYSLAENNDGLTDLLEQGVKLFEGAPSVTIIKQLGAAGISAQAGDDPDQFMESYWRNYNNTAGNG